MLFVRMLMVIAFMVPAFASGNCPEEGLAIIREFIRKQEVQRAELQSYSMLVRMTGTRTEKGDNNALREHPGQLSAQRTFSRESGTSYENLAYTGDKNLEVKSLFGGFKKIDGPFKKVMETDIKKNPSSQQRQKELREQAARRTILDKYNFENCVLNINDGEHAGSVHKFQLKLKATDHIEGSYRTGEIVIDARTNLLLKETGNNIVLSGVATGLGKMSNMNFVYRTQIVDGKYALGLSMRAIVFSGWDSFHKTDVTAHYEIIDYK